jgi:hypothetical protein
MNIIEAIQDPALFHPLFKDLTTWRSWMVVLKAIFALPMDESDRALFTQLTGRQKAPTAQAKEVWLVIGRRGGKSRIVALLGVFLATFRSYAEYLSPGERGVLMIVATDRRQARVIHKYIAAFLESVPMLAAMIERQDSESIDLSNSITIQIQTASFRSIRGYTVVGMLADELAFWKAEDSATPAEDVIAAVRPAMSTVPGAMLIGLSTPYRRSGPLWEAYRRFYGKEDSRVQVFQADTRTMNPCVPQDFIDQAFEDDPTNASAEYLAQFRSDVGTFLDPDSVERAITEVGRVERAPQYTVKGEYVRYAAFCDPSGGRADSMTLAIGHREGERVVLDVCRGVVPPFDPSAVVQDFAQTLKAYRCHEIFGDRYSGEWVVEAYRKVGIFYRSSDFSKSELYLEALPLFAQGAVDLLDNKKLIVELLGLERRTSRSGKDSIDHGPGSGAHDDLANSCCGCLALLASQESQRGYEVPLSEFFGGSVDRGWF